jgi:hypothetical protein
MHVTPETAVPVYVSYGDAPEAVVHFADGSVKHVAVEDVHEYTSQKANPNNHLGVTFVEQQVPVGFLRNGTRLIDTPGLDDAEADEVYTERTLQELDVVDAGVVLFLSPPTVGATELEVPRAGRRPRPEEDLPGLQHVPAALPRPETRNAVLEYVGHADRRGVPQGRRGGEVRVYPVCALEAWQARQTDDIDLWKRSGADRLLRDIENYLSDVAGQQVLATRPTASRRPPRWPRPRCRSASSCSRTRSSCRPSAAARPQHPRPRAPLRRRRVDGAHRGRAAQDAHPRAGAAAVQPGQEGPRQARDARGARAVRVPVPPPARGRRRAGLPPVRRGVSAPRRPAPAPAAGAVPGGHDRPRAEPAAGAAVVQRAAGHPRPAAAAAGGAAPVRSRPHGTSAVVGGLSGGGAALVAAGCAARPDRAARRRAGRLEAREPGRPGSATSSRPAPRSSRPGSTRSPPSCCATSTAGRAGVETVRSAVERRRRAFAHDLYQQFEVVQAISDHPEALEAYRRDARGSSRPSRSARPGLAPRGVADALALRVLLGGVDEPLLERVDIRCVPSSTRRSSRSSRFWISSTRLAGSGSSSIFAWISGSFALDRPTVHLATGTTLLLERREVLADLAALLATFGERGLVLVAHLACHGASFFGRPPRTRGVSGRFPAGSHANRNTSLLRTSYPT